MGGGAALAGHELELREHRQERQEGRAQQGQLLLLQGTLLGQLEQLLLSQWVGDGEKPQCPALGCTPIFATVSASQMPPALGDTLKGSSLSYSPHPSSLGEET